MKKYIQCLSFFIVNIIILMLLINPAVKRRYSIRRWRKKLTVVIEIVNQS